MIYIVHRTNPMKLKHLLKYSIGLSLVLFVSCKSVGPKTLPADQFEFNASMSEASDEQLLLNLVRLRYNESPVFLKVSSVINQYTRAGNVNAQGGLNNAIPTGENSALAGVNYAWSNTPTITYIPISGREFSTNLLVPLPPGSLFGMIQAGWPIDLVLDITTFSINGLQDDVARPTARREADKGFYELLELWSKLSHEGIIGVRKENQSEILFVKKEVPLTFQNDLDRFKELLNLDPSLSEYTINYGAIQNSNAEITALTGSIWEIMLNLAWRFDVPKEHLDSGRTYDTFHPTQEKDTPPIDLQFSKERPDNAFVKILHHDYWFYIHLNDRKSKRNFSFLQLLLNLAESTTANQAPVVTVPTN